MNTRTRRELPLARYIFDRTATLPGGVSAMHLRVTSLGADLPPNPDARPGHRVVIEAQRYEDALAALTEDVGDCVVRRPRVA